MCKTERAHGRYARNRERAARKTRAANACVAHSGAGALAMAVASGIRYVMTISTTVDNI